MNRNLSAVQHGTVIPDSYSGTNMRNPFNTRPYEDDVPDISPFSGVKRSQTVQPLSASNRTSATRETAWSTTSLKQESPVAYSSQTRGSLFQWDDGTSNPAVIRPQNN